MDVNSFTRLKSISKISIRVSRVTKAIGFIKLFRKRLIMGSEYGSRKSYNLQVSCSTKADGVIAVQTQIPENEGSPWGKLQSKSKGLDNQECQWLRAREDGCPSSHREKKICPSSTFCSIQALNWLDDAHSIDKSDPLNLLTLKCQSPPEILLQTSQEMMFTRDLGIP